MLLIALLAGLGGMIGWGFGDFFAKNSVDKLGPIKSLVWAHIFGSSIFIAVALVELVIRPGTVSLPAGGAWLGLAGFGALQMIIYWLLYIGFEKGQLAVLNPVFASFSGLVALIAILFLGEAANALTAVALVALLLAILLLNADLEALRRRRLNILPGLKEVGLATCLAAVWTLGWDRFVGGHNPLTYALWMYVFMTAAALVLALLLRSAVTGIPRKYWKFLVLTGLGEATAYLAISWGYSSTNLTAVVALVSGAFSAPTVILAFLFLKERLTRVQIGAIGIILVAVAALAVT